MRIKLGATVVVLASAGAAAMGGVSAQAHSHPGRGHSGQNQSGQNPSGQNQSGQNQSGQNQSGQNQSGQGQSGQDGSGQDQSGQGRAGNGTVKHVLLISVDGLHQSDLVWYVQQHPNSELAKLATRGLQYTNAQTPIPSDSFPGMVAQVTGGNPRTTGVYYDAEYNHALLPAGSSCTPGQTTGLGAQVNYFEINDKNPLSIDAGQGLPGLPDGVMNMTGHPADVIDTSTLPIDPSNCQPVFPHQYLQVNTIFEVASGHGLLTAWSDKHPAYDILNGPSGTGIADEFTPEINSNAFHPDGTPYTNLSGGQADWTQDNAATRQYDSYKVQSVLNEIDGFDHSRTNSHAGVPAIFGMNFQTISTAEKLPQSEIPGQGVLAGGYQPGTITPGPLLSNALDWLNGKLAAMASELRAQGLARSTAIVLSAKHGQSPQDPNQLVRIDDGPIITGINDAWRAHLGNPNAPDLVATGTNDDAFMLWLTDRSKEAAKFVAKYLMDNSATGNTYNAAHPAQAGPDVTLPHSGLVKVYTGDKAARYWGVSPSDPRHPDVWGIVRVGVVYTGGVGKIAEHGGANPADRSVPLVVYAPAVAHPATVKDQVETTQIAPTILRLLGLDPNQLDAVRIENTQVLPHLGP